MLQCHVASYQNFHFYLFEPGQEVKFQRSSIEGPIIGGPFSLFDAEGRVVTEKSLLGNWVLLYFGYTSSPDIGPAEVQKMAKAIDTLGLFQLQFDGCFWTLFLIIAEALFSGCC